MMYHVQASDHPFRLTLQVLWADALPVGVNFLALFCLTLSRWLFLGGTPRSASRVEATTGQTWKSIPTLKIPASAGSSADKPIPAFESIILHSAEKFGKVDSTVQPFLTEKSANWLFLRRITNSCSRISSIAYHGSRLSAGLLDKELSKKKIILQDEYVDSCSLPAAVGDKLMFKF